MRLRSSFAFLAASLLVLAVLCPAAHAQRLDGPSIMTSVRASELSSGVSVSKTFSYQLPLDDRQAIVLSAEHVRVTTLPGEIGRQVNAKPTWKFTGLPLTVGYSYALTDPEQPVVPIIGAGVSYYVCRSKLMAMPGAGDALATSAAADPSYRKGLGMGYGAQATLGLRVDVSRDLFVLAQGRARYVNGRAFSPGSDLGAEFTHLDFALGFGFKF